MAAMNSTNRTRCMARFMRDTTATIAISKPDLLAAVNATDDWIDANATAFNNALPTAAKNNLTAAQKTVLFMYVAARRAGLLTVAEDL